MTHIYDTIIIGGGPAGYTAALYASRAALDTCVLEKLSPGGQMALTGDIDNYPGFEEGIDGFTLGMKMQQSAERFGAKTEYTEVISVDFSGKIKKLVTDSGEYFAKTVIISTGANPKELGIENEYRYTGRGVHYCAHCDGRFYKDKTVVVVGGGNSAVSDALYLARLAKKVYVIHRRDAFTATRVYTKPLLQTKNVEVLFNCTVEDIVVKDDRVRAVKVAGADAFEIECDGVFVGIGRKPATEFLQGKVMLDHNGYIVANESTATDIEGVYAIGDVRTKDLRQVVTAVSDGAVAAYFAEQYITETDF